QNANSLADHQSRIGDMVNVLVEGPSRVGERQSPGLRQLTGRTMTDHIVVFDGHDRLIGQSLNMKITEASPFTLYGVVETGEVPGDELRPREPKPIGRSR